MSYNDSYRIFMTLFYRRLFINLHDYISIRSYKTTTLNPHNEAFGLNNKHPAEFSAGCFYCNLQSGVL